MGTAAPGPEEGSEEARDWKSSKEGVWAGVGGTADSRKKSGLYGKGGRRKAGWWRCGGGDFGALGWWSCSQHAEKVAS
jgi:hypothetical protein